MLRLTLKYYNCQSCFYISRSVLSRGVYSSFFQRKITLGVVFQRGGKKEKKGKEKRKEEKRKGKKKKRKGKKRREKGTKRGKKGRKRGKIERKR